MIQYFCPDGCSHNLQLQFLRIVSSPKGSLIEGTMIVDERRIKFNCPVPEWVLDDLTASVNNQLNPTNHLPILGRPPGS